MASVNDRVAHLLSRTIANEAGCMEFVGCVQANGYGRATVNRHTDYAHRHVYRLTHGAIPEGLDVCHKCDNRRCINPEHLFVGSRRENMADAVSKGRQAKGFQLPQTKLTQFVRLEITRLAAAGIPYKEIATQFGICKQHAGHIAITNGVRRNGIGQ